VPAELLTPSDRDHPAAQERLRVIAEITSLLKRRRKIEAIKLYRETFAVGLKEAKEVIENLEAQLPGGPEPVIERPAGNRSCVGVILVLFLLIGAGAAVLSFILGGGTVQEAVSSIGEQVAPPNRIMSGPALFISGIDGAPADVVFLQRNFDEDSLSVSYFDGTTGERRWQSEPFAGDSDIPYFAYEDSLVFAVLETTLRAYDLFTRSLSWEAKLSDQIHSVCRDCLQPFGEQILLLTTDGYVQAYRAEDGKLQWRERVNGLSSRRLFRLGANVGFMNERVDAGNGLDIRDPSTGNLVRRLEPRCEHEVFDPQEPDLDDPAVVEAADKHITFLFGFFEPGCIQQWDYESGERIWDVFTELTALGSDVPLLNGRSSIYVVYGGNRLHAVDKYHGNVMLITDQEDYDLTPLAESADVLLVKASKLRGTRRDELWAVHNKGDEILWRHVPQAGEALELSEEKVIWESDEGYWYAQLTSVGNILMQTRHQPPRLVFQSIDLLNGASSEQIELPVSGQFDSNYHVELLGWSQNVLWIKLDFLNAARRWS
jgi:outer membrane protein assembly factor BamB